MLFWVSTDPPAMSFSQSQLLTLNVALASLFLLRTNVKTCCKVSVVSCINITYIVDNSFVLQIHIIIIARSTISQDDDLDGTTTPCIPTVHPLQAVRHDRRIYYRNGHWQRDNWSHDCPARKSVNDCPAHKEWLSRTQITQRSRPPHKSVNDWPAHKSVNHCST